MSIAHVFFNKNEDPNKFVPQYCSMIKKEFGFSEHRFLYMGDKINNGDFDSEYCGCTFQDVYRLSNIIKGYDKIIFHSTPHKTLILYFAFLFWFRKKLHLKMYLSLWGGEIHHRSSTLKSRIRDLFLKKFMSYFSGFITYLGEDYDLAKRFSGAKAKHVNLGGFYPSNVVPSAITPARSNTTKILVGSSALERNKHMSIIDILKKRLPKERDITIFIPLSYGDPLYAEKVKNYAMNHLEHYNVECLFELMEFSDYIAFLASMDIAIFAHEGQQGMGNIRNLLGAGSSVYLNASSISYRYLSHLGFTVGDFKDFKFEKVINHRNMKLAKSHFSLESTLNKQSEFFSVESHRY